MFSSTHGTGAKFSWRSQKKGGEKEQSRHGKGGFCAEEGKTKAPKKVIIQNMCEDEDDEYEGEVASGGHE